MALSKKEVGELLRLVGLTADEEIDCDQCLERVAEFAEKNLSGQSVPKGLEAVKHHLTVCAECCEEYKSLQQALEGLED